MNTKYIKAILTSIFTLALYFVVYNAVSYLAYTRFGLSYVLSMMTGAGLGILFVLYPFFFTPKPEGKISRWETALWIFATMVLGIVMNIILAGFSFVKNSEALERANEYLANGPVWQSLLLVGLFAPALEELVFRGVIFGQFRSAFGLIPGMIVSALVFGAIHMNLPQFVYAAAMGLVLSFVYDRSKSIVASIAAHGLTNLAVTLFSAYIGFSR